MDKRYDEIEDINEDFTIDEYLRTDQISEGSQKKTSHVCPRKHN